MKRPLLIGLLLPLIGLLPSLRVDVLAQSVPTPEGEWLVTADLPDGKYHVPIEITRHGKDSISANALGDGVQFSSATFKKGQLTIVGTSSLGPIEIRTVVEGSSMRGDWHSGSSRGKVEGEYQKTNSSPQSRLQVFDEVCQGIGKEYFDPAFGGLDWRAVQAKYRVQAENLQTDGELFRTVNDMLSELKTSHLRFTLLSPALAFEANSTGESAPVTWRRLSSDAGYIKISSFQEGPEFLRLIDNAFADLGNAPAMIIDLRNDGGGTLGGAMRLGDHLLDQTQEVGVFATRAALERNNLKSMDQLDATNLPKYSGYDVDGFRSMLRETGALLLVTGGRANPPYRGKLIILVNRGTASAAEAFVAVIKELNRGVVVGPRPTAGKMLSSKELNLSGGWVLTLPEADFRTPKGLRLEGHGVTPDIVVKPTSGKDYGMLEALRLAEQSHH